MANLYIWYEWWGGSWPPAAVPSNILLRSHFPAEAAAADLQTLAAAAAAAAADAAASSSAAATAAVPGLKVKVTTTASLLSRLSQVLKSTL